MKAKIEVGVDRLDRIVLGVAIPWMKMSKNQIAITFAHVFRELDIETTEHLIGKYQSDKDFARFYLNAGSNVKRAIFNYYKAPCQDDKIEDSLEVFKALSIGRISRWGVFSFDTEIVHQFYLMAYNNSLQLLEKIYPEAYLHIKNRKIDLFGNGKNWSKAWSVFTEKEKREVVEYLLNNKF